jgi:hypothetical protein
VVVILTNTEIELEVYQLIQKTKISGDLNRYGLFSSVKATGFLPILQSQWATSSFLLHQP